MPLPWLSVQRRRSIALLAVLLSMAGWVLGEGLSAQDLARLKNALSSEDDASGRVLELTDRSRASAAFAGRGASGSLTLSHGALLAHGTRTVYAELRVRAEDGEAGRRTPVSMVLVLDTSGSMAGTKIDDARRAARAMVGEMRGDDQLALVAFATDATTLVPLGRVNDVRERALRQIDGLRAAGSTDIANALRIAEQELRGDEYRATRIVLVTDGRDTSGAPRDRGPELARQAALRGVTVSALGIGADYDHAYLADISSLGRGNYEFLGDSGALARFLSKELGEAMRLALAGVKLELSLPRGARITDVWGATPSSYSSSLMVGSLFAGDERRVLVSLELEAGEPGTALSLPVTLRYRDAAGEPETLRLDPVVIEVVATQGEVDAARDGAVLATFASIEASRREAEAALAFERGDRARALELNEMNRKDLEEAAQRAPVAAATRLRAQSKAYEGNKRTYTTAPVSAAPARSIAAGEQKNLDRAVAY